MQHQFVIQCLDAYSQQANIITAHSLETFDSALETRLLVATLHVIAPPTECSGNYRLGAHCVITTPDARVSEGL